MHNMSIIDTEIKDAMDNAKKLFDVDLTDDDGGGITAESILYRLNDEDPEMVQSTLSTVQNIKELYTLELQIIFPKPQAGG